MKESIELLNKVEEELDTYECEEKSFGKFTFHIFRRKFVTKSKKTSRKKYSKCLICPETRYIERHHIRKGLTIPLCPVCHKATLVRDLVIIEVTK